MMARPSKDEQRKLLGVHGVDGGSLDGPLQDSIFEIMEALLKDNRCAAVGEQGAVHIWIKPSGLYHCAFYRFWEPVEQREFRTRLGVRHWLEKWWPRLTSYSDKK